MIDTPTSANTASHIVDTPKALSINTITFTKIAKKKKKKKIEDLGFEVEKED